MIFYLFIVFLSFVSVFVLVLDLAPKVEPRIPGASLSQSVAVEETVLPAASQNITAYAVNTEPSQGYRRAPLRHASFLCLSCPNFSLVKRKPLCNCTGLSGPSYVKAQGWWRSGRLQRGNKTRTEVSFLDPDLLLWRRPLSTSWPIQWTRLSTL